MINLKEQPATQEYVEPDAKKRAKSTYWIFIVLGIGSLLPFGCIVVPVDFWAEFYDAIFPSVSVLCYNAGNWATMVFMLRCGHKLNKNKLVLTSLTTWLVCLTFIPLVHPIVGNRTAKTVITIIPVALCGIANGFYFPSILQIASKISPLNAQAMMAGNGIAGLIPQCLLILIKAIVALMDVSPEQYTRTLFVKTLTYFVIAAAFVVLCFAAWIKLVKQGHVQRPVLREDCVQNSEQRSSIWQITKTLAVPVVAIFMIFAVSLAIFPAIIMPIPCNTLAKAGRLGSDQGWWNIGVMTTFTVFDWAGRQLPQFKWASSISLKTCFAISICRLSFFGVFIMEAVPTYTCLAASATCTGGPIVKSDVTTIITMVLFGLSSGWISSVIMMKFMALIKKPADCGLAANVQTFALNSGLFCGGLLSLAVATITK